MNLIPKIFHYIWLGSQELPPHLKRCLITWQKHNPDYELHLWDNDRISEFDSQFLSDALRKRRWAFASDYLRLAILDRYGGIYLDTDMLAIRPLPQNILNQEFFIGEETPGQMSFGIIGSVPHGEIITFMRNCYNTIRFDVFDPPIIPRFLGPKVLSQFPAMSMEVPEIFYPLPFAQRNSDFSPFVTGRTLFVHLWDHSWSSPKARSTISKLFEVLVDVVFYQMPYSYLHYYVKVWGLGKSDEPKPEEIRYYEWAAHK